MVDIFITDSREKYDQSSHPDRILYLNGFIGDCSFIDRATLDDFNDTLVGLDDEAYRVMLIKLDEDTRTIIDRGLQFSANTFISSRPDTEKIHSLLYNFHKHFLVNKYLFQLCMDRLLSRFASANTPLTLYLSENYYLTQDLPFDIRSAIYYPAFKNVYIKFLAKQVYYFFYHLFVSSPKVRKTQVAIFLLDIPNEADLLKRFIELVKKQNDLSVTLVVIDSGNPPENRADLSGYEGENVMVTNIYKEKKPLLVNYSSFYAVCKKLNPLYSIYKKARFSETEDLQYSFVNNTLSKISPDVCLYTNIQEHGRIVANVCAQYNIPSICVEYAFAFDTYTMEKRIRFDVRACLSEVTAQNWVKRKDPSPRREVIGFCKIDDWSEKLAKREKATHEKPFNNTNRTILFASTWSPNPDSPLLTEKVKIVEKLSDICYHHGWNLLIKKHPSEIDTLVADALSRNKHPDQRIVEHNEMTLFDCIYYSDFVCTQNSSAFIETLYLNKPFSYITANGENVWAHLSYFSREKAVGTFRSVEDYEQYLLSNVGEKEYARLLGEFAKLQTKFLYKTDSKASERLLALVRSFVK